MLMGRIRNSKNKYRGLFIAVVLLLTVSLVGTFAVWSSPTPSNSDDTASEDAVQKQIAALKNIIENEKAAAEIGFSENSQIAENLISLAQAYSQVGDSENMTATAKEAVLYYQAALDNAPAELNARGKADIISNKAYASSLSGDVAAAESAYQEAIEVDPLNWKANIGYAEIIYSSTAADGKPNYQETLDYLKNYQSQLGTDSEHATELANYISTIEAQMTAAETDTGAADNTTGTDGGTTTE